MNEAECAYIRSQVTIGARAKVRVIIAEVCAKYNLNPENIIGRGNARAFAWPRQEIMWRARQETAASLPMIGKLLGGRDHTTIIHGIRAHERRLCEFSTDSPRKERGLITESRNQACA